jgi:hypothetical protein
MIGYKLQLNLNSISLFNGSHSSSWTLVFLFCFVFGPLQDLAYGETTKNIESSPRDVIVVSENSSTAKESKSLLSSFFKKRARKLDRGGFRLEADLLSLRGVQFGAGIENRSLSRSEVTTSPERLRRKNISPQGEWTETKVSSIVAFPHRFSTPSLLGPLGLNLGGEIGRRRDYRILRFIEKSDENSSDPSLPLEKDPSYLDEVSSLGKFSLNGLRAYRLELDPMKVYESYGLGTEIELGTHTALLSQTGLHASLFPARYNLDLVLTHEGDLSKTLRVLPGLNGPLFALRFRKKRTKGEGREKSLQLTSSVLEVGRLSGVLKMNLFQNSSKKTNSTSLDYSFVYDSTYPKAMEALKKAIRGDLRPSQSLAIESLYPQKSYAGVILEAQNLEATKALLQEEILGFHFAKSWAKGKLAKVKAGDFKKGLFITEKKRKEGLTTKRKKSFYHRATPALESFESKISTSSNKTLFGWSVFGLLGSRSSRSLIKSQVIPTWIQSEGQSAQRINLLNLSASYRFLSKKGRGERNQLVDGFFRSAEKVLGWNHKILQKSIGFLRNERRCHEGDVEIKIDGTLYHHALLKALELTEGDLWVYLGRYLDMSVPYRLKAYGLGMTRTPLESYLQKDQIELIKGFEEDFLPSWRSAKTVFEKGTLRRQNKSEIARRLKEIFSSYEGSLFPFEFLFTLSSRDYQREKDRDRYLQGMMVRYDLQTDTCDLSWTEKGSSLFQLSDLSRDWL